MNWLQKNTFKKELYFARPVFALFLTLCEKPSAVPELSFLPAPHRGWTRADERRVQDNLHSHAQNAAIFFPQIGAKTIFGSIFQIWLVARFSECNIQTTISVSSLVVSKQINYYIAPILTYDSKNVIYLVSCKKNTNLSALALQQQNLKWE